MERIAIKTDFIKLEALLKFSALTSSGGEAKTVIGEGLVGVNGETCLQRERKIYPGDIVSFCGAELMVEKEENKQKGFLFKGMH